MGDTVRSLVGGSNVSLAELEPLLRCPATGAPLERVGGSLCATGNGRAYPIVDGVPVLIASERSLFDPDDYAAPPPMLSLAARAKQSAKRLVQRFLALPPSLSRNLVADENLNRLAELLRERREAGGRSLLLVVGGATLGVGVSRLMEGSEIGIVETDIGLTPRVMVVCDGHDLPFVDQAFDGVICQAVLEHVLDPQRVADEIWRVLAPGGLVYSEIPFMQQVHGGAFDFTRFTPLGHRRLWRRFDEIGSGADTGPGMALGWSILYFARSLSPRLLWPAVARIVSLLFFWLKYLDPWLVTRPAALDAVSGSFFLGARRETPLGDRQIVNGYRGGDRPPHLRIDPD